ncbi:MAG TPA: AsnC family transcriptional regulator [Firmicutes bacterium]|nr:AsnC family transcriptional regulator [Bacillota bacterium]
MRLSSRGEYGVRAMIHLALNYHQGFIPLSSIASAEDISQQYLEQIFASLRRSGLILSNRGVKGGYTLALPPQSIYVGDIIRVLDGPITPVGCVSDEGDEDDSRCGKSNSCLARNLWLKLRDHINQLLDSITLQDMLNWKQ